MRKRTAIRFISYAAVAALVFGCVSAYQYNRAESYRRSLNAGYQHAFSELVTSCRQIDSALQKSLYATSPGTVRSLCGEVYAQSMTAQMSLGALPCGTTSLMETAGFISRIGDYAYSLSRSASNDGYSGDERENLKKLSDTATILSQNLNSLAEDMNIGRLTMDELIRAGMELNISEDEVPGTIGDSMRIIEMEFPECPSLIYDGPFSAHISDKKPMLLEGTADVSEDRAREIAAVFLGVPEAKVYLESKSANSIPTYNFCADLKDCTSCVSVTVQGGKVLSMLCSRLPGRSVINKDDALKNARRFLDMQGIKDMKESYFAIADNIMTVNFAYTRGGVICYPDLIQVGIAMDTGSVLCYEARGYVGSHHDRTLPEPSVSLEAAQAKVGEGLTVKSSALALIPTAGGGEVLCYEFKCANDSEQSYIVYVNAQTCEQEKILILLEDDTGALTL